MSDLCSLARSAFGECLDVDVFACTVRMMTLTDAELCNLDLVEDEEG